ncbi:hypothetical protein BGZ76_009148 [Entomortierella beljakovae]|nr:hypothetical protein BGZ76_009148 [Entomortierella beljakovae]
MMHSQLKLVLVAMLIALIATMDMAATAKTTPTHTTISIHKKAPQNTVSPHHKKTHSYKVQKPTTTVHHKTTQKPKKPTITKTKKSTTKATKPTPIPTTSKSRMGQAGTIVSQTDFCIFLPPKFGGDIAANEDHAVAFCTKPKMTSAPNAQVLPAGFIKTAHFVSNTTGNWVQVTGRLDRSKYGLSPKDGGGQYDLRVPVGAFCSGYKSFVQLTEPDAQIYCIRCQNKLDCPVNKSTYGCRMVLGGNYV